jgi:hypothetical protein
MTINTLTIESHLLFDRVFDQLGAYSVDEGMFSLSRSDKSGLMEISAQGA